MLEQKIDELTKAVSNLTQIAQALVETNQMILSQQQGAGPRQETTQTQPAPTQPQSPPPAPPQAAQPASAPVTPDFQAVQSELGQIAQKLGGPNKVIELLRAKGAERLSDLDPSRYGELLTEARTLVQGG